LLVLLLLPVISWIVLLYRRGRLWLHEIVLGSLVELLVLLLLELLLPWSLLTMSLMTLCGLLTDVWLRPSLGHLILSLVLLLILLLLLLLRKSSCVLRHLHLDFLCLVRESWPYYLFSNGSGGVAIENSILSKGYVWLLGVSN
jgi:hypothetical protein